MQHMHFSNTYLVNIIFCRPTFFAIQHYRQFDPLNTILLTWYLTNFASKYLVILTPPTKFLIFFCQVVGSEDDNMILFHEKIRSMYPSLRSFFYQTDTFDNFFFPLMWMVVCCSYGCLLFLWLLPLSSKLWLPNHSISFECFETVVYDMHLLLDSSSLCHASYLIYGLPYNCT